MRRTMLALVAPVTALAAAPAAAEPVVLKPSSQWNVDFAEDQCRLVRLFGPEEDRHFLSFQQYWPAKQTGLTIAGSAFKRFRSLERTYVRFHDMQEPLRTLPFTGSVEEYGTGVIYSSIGLDESEPESGTSDDEEDAGWEMLDLELAKKVEFVEIKQGSRVVRLETGPLDAAFEVLNQCTLDLLRDWGLDPERHLTLQNGPRWVNQTLIARRIMADYPDSALLQGEQGIMRMRVIVSAEGAVESCTILKATQTQSLESPACKLMKSAKFEPARDAAGEPFRSYYATSITYRMR